MVATAAVKRSKVCTRALRCFSLKGTHVTFTYNLSARTSHMALHDCKRSGQCGEGGDLTGCAEISATMTEWWEEGGDDDLSEETNEVRGE